MFWSQFDAFRHRFKAFEFWSKYQNFPNFRPKTIEKNDIISPFKRKIGSKNAFQAQKVLFSKTTDNVDAFCTLFESPTPKTAEISGDTLVTKRPK